jgi:hypothetical protein
MLELSALFLLGLAVGWAARGYRDKREREYRIIDRVR